jgi:signal transduction histidine kinase
VQTLDEAILATEQALTEGRDAIHGLRPEPAAQSDLAELLTAAGQEQADAHDADKSSPSFRMIVEGKPQRLSPVLQDEICRIGREAIRNAFHHAVASHIEVEIRYDERELRLRIRDNGRGIDPKILKASGRPGHWGLPGMRERAQRIGSRLEFWSEAGAGTEVQLVVPGAVVYEKQRDSHRFRLFHWGGRNGRRS